MLSFVQILSTKKDNFLLSFSHYVQNGFFAVVNSRFVFYNLATFLTLEYNHFSLFGIKFNLYWHQKPFAIIFPVTRIYINMQRIKTIWAMVSWWNNQGLHNFLTILTHKSVVIFCKCFHFSPSVTIKNQISYNMLWKTNDFFIQNFRTSNTTVIILV